MLGRSRSSAGWASTSWRCPSRCLAYTDDPRVGKNMFVLGFLCEVFGRSLEAALSEVAHIFAMTSEEVVRVNQALLKGGYEYARNNVEHRYEIPPLGVKQDMVVMNGNEGFGLGVMASGMEVVALYPLTPATSAFHILPAPFRIWGGENPQVLGMCPMLALTNSAINALAMGGATFFVRLGSSLPVSTLRSIIPSALHVHHHHRDLRHLVDMVL